MSRSCSPASPNYTPATPVGLDEDMAFGLFDDDDIVPLAAPIAPLPQLAQSTATISKSPMTVSYTVEAPTTIPNNGLPYKVLVCVCVCEFYLQGARGGCSFRGGLHPHYHPA